MRHGAHKMVKLSLDRSKIVEDVCMIELEIVEHGGLRPVMDELRPFVEERRVVFIGLDDEEWRLRVARRNRKIHRHPPDQESRRAPGPFEHPREHGRSGGLAVRACDSEYMLSGEYVLRQ